MSFTAIVNARLLDGNGAAPRESMAVLVSQTTLAQICPMSEFAPPPGCRIINANGATVLPTLIDGHMHISREPGKLDHLGHLKTNLEAVGKLQQCLKWGTALVGHAAGSAESVILREAVAGGAVPGCADILVGGAVTATCGHVAGYAADGPWQIRQAVRELVGAGVDFIKTCASGGFQRAYLSPTHTDYCPEELAAVVAEAHARGKRVHAHAHAQPGLQNAIEAGCDVILHGAFIDDAALDAIAAKGLYYMPTLHITSEKVIGKGCTLPAYMVERMKRAQPIHREGVRKARQRGVKVITGTDGGPGSIMNELVELVACGFSPLEAITMTTRATAEAFGVIDRTGTLETGKRADLMIVAGAPDRDISIMTALDSIVLVMKNGEILA